LTLYFFEKVRELSLIRARCTRALNVVRLMLVIFLVAVPSISSWACFFPHEQTAKDVSSLLQWCVAGFSLIILRLAGAAVKRRLHRSAAAHARLHGSKLKFFTQKYTLWMMAVVLSDMMWTYCDTNYTRIPAIWANMMMMCLYCCLCAVVYTTFSFIRPPRMTSSTRRRGGGDRKLCNSSILGSIMASTFFQCLKQQQRRRLLYCCCWWGGSRRQGRRTSRTWYRTSRRNLNMQQIYVVNNNHDNMCPVSLAEEEEGTGLRDWAKYWYAPEEGGLRRPVVYISSSGGAESSEVSNSHNRSIVANSYLEGA